MSAPLPPGPLGTAWPFAVVSTPTSGYGVAAAPDFLVARGRSFLLTDHATGEPGDRAYLLGLTGADGARLWLLYRMVPLQAGEVGQDGEVAYAGSRLASVLEGVVTLEQPACAPTAEYFDGVHELVRTAVREYFLADDSRRPARPMPGTAGPPAPDGDEAGNVLPLTVLNPKRTKEHLHVADVPLPPGERDEAAGPAAAPPGTRPTGSGLPDRQAPDLGRPGADPAGSGPGGAGGPGTAHTAGAAATAGSSGGAGGGPGGFGRPALAVIGALSLLVFVLLVLLAVK
ncbi:hypothetical protein [Kitasatospora sp. NBC_00458]|uniref:hypothetical protein n=1 Tax=Kitasatospora sp. NBC_00458 TaxID=2903568 RepID=UPI002E17B0A8